MARGTETRPAMKLCALTSKHLHGRAIDKAELSDADARTNDGDDEMGTKHAAVS